MLAIEATGKVTPEDYHNTLIPKAEAMMAKGPIRMLYVIGKEFSGYELEALWDDGKIGLKHWHDFSSRAGVSDQAWIRAAVHMVQPFVTCKGRMLGHLHL